MSSSGPNSPGTVVSDDTIGVEAWYDTSNATASDNATAHASRSVLPKVTQWLKATDFGFAIPTGATITGIVVAIERKATANSSMYARDYALKLVKDDVAVGDSLADTVTKWPVSDAVASYGGETNLWGTSLSPADVNASTFGAALSAYLYPSIKESIRADVDHIAITVYYTEGGGASAVPVIMNQYRQRRT